MVKAIVLRETGVFVIVFLLMLFFLLVGGCGESELSSSRQDEHDAGVLLVELESLVEHGDYVRGAAVVDQIREKYIWTDAVLQRYHTFREHAEKIESQITDCEDKTEYILCLSASDREMPAKVKSLADKLIESDSRLGIVAFRVILEDEQSEEMFQVYGEDIRLYVGQGFSRLRTVSSGNVIVVSNEPYCGARCEGGMGKIRIGNGYHYSPEIQLEFEEGKAKFLGEILVRSFPKEETGDLAVTVIGEDGLEVGSGDGEAVIGRYFAFRGRRRHFIPENGRVVFRSLAPGKYKLRVDGKELFESRQHDVEVFAGETTDVELVAYGLREVELDWRFHRSDEPAEWSKGRATIKSGDYWQPGDAWGGIGYPVVDISKWDEKGCTIRSSNGSIIALESSGPFEEMSFPSNPSRSSLRKHPIKDGAVYAWWREHKGVRLRALFRVRKVTVNGD